MFAFTNLDKPLVTELVRGKKGPMCHLGLETDEKFQATGQGKIAFPMMTTSIPPVLGLYKVLAIQDRGNYYILRGHNTPYNAPTAEAFLAYLKASGSIQHYTGLNEKACLVKTITLPGKQGQLLCIRHWRNNNAYDDISKAYHTLWYTDKDQKEILVSGRWTDLAELIEHDTDDWQPISSWLNI